MPNCHFFASSTLALALTLTSACNPEPVVIPPIPDAGAGGTGTTVNNATGSGSTMDAGNSGAPVVPYTDAGNGNVDGGFADSGPGSLGDGGGAAVGFDASTAGGDAAVVSDAGGDGAVPCSINDPRFGCGTRVSLDWVHFASGLDIDIKYGRAWSPVIKAGSFQALRAACAALVVDRVTNFEAPEVDDVRTLAAGCAATVPGGSCAVESGVVLPSESGNCICGAAIGPNQGKFCRPEVPDCETLWTLTECGIVNAECPTARSWFYDVRTGSLVLAGPTDPLALEAKVRCVAPISYRAP